MVTRALLTLLLITASLQAYTKPSEEPLVYGSPDATIENPDFTSSSVKSRVHEKLLYVTVGKKPEKLYVGQIFPITLKITALRRHVPILLTLVGGRGVKTIRADKYITPGAIHHETLYFKATAPKVVLPIFRLRYEDQDQTYDIKLSPLQAVSLNPPSDFSGLLAKNLTLLNYQASAYDEKSNILSLHLRVTMGNAEDFHIPGALKGEIDRIEGDYNDTTLDYSATFPLYMDQVKFSYFNIETNRYEKFRVPILVKRSRVSTQTDLDPRASEFTKFKIGLTVALIILFTLLWYRRRSWIYPLLILLAGTYLVTYLMPLKSVCIKKGATLYLLPTPQSTPFLYTQHRIEAKEMDRVNRYLKVQLPNHRIGWVKDEDICQN